ncbi:MAG: hypothetical protein PHE02_06860 [Lachnospiraceae bacterium]|nr:hypothetical protein [Lachnospiraceae bacterium]
MKTIMKQIVTLCLAVTLTLGVTAPIISHAAPGDTTVYITNTGSKYHTDGCRYLAKSKHAISLQDAINSGYTACSRCGASASVETAPVSAPATESTVSAAAATPATAVESATPEFDAAFYAAAYPDVAATYGNDPTILYQHYVLYGAAEGRFPTMNAYLAAVQTAQTVAQ